MKKIILRLDLNVPIDYKNNKILETERINVVLTEIKKLTKKNKVTILAHLGKGDKKETLRPIEIFIRKKLTKEENQNLFIHENVRWQKGEVDKENTEAFKKATKYFAELGDEYIDDAFSAMHREHASIVGLPKLFKKEGKKISLGEYSKIEIKNLEKTLKLSKNPKNNTLLILSGAKISTKLPLIKKFLALNAKIFIGGGIANQILKDILNIEIGKSFIEKDFKISNIDKNLFKKAIKDGKLILPIDAIYKSKNSQNIDLITKIKKNDTIADIGPATFAKLQKEIGISQNIIMNGPLGIYEEGFSMGTIALLKEIKKLKINILIGGGDTLVLTKKLKMMSQNNMYISTAGGAMLEFLTKDGDLPGIKALK